MDIPKILIKIRPGEKWNLADIEKGYEGLVWMDATDKPTLKEIETAWPILQAEMQAIKDAEQAKIAAKTQAIVGSLPSWAEVSTAIDNAATLAALKVIVKKMARVVYWLAKDSAE